jgi:DNA polymerase elongation subunit (family B)
LEKPEPSGKDAWLLNWMMTRSTADVKLAIAAGPEKVIAAAEAEFSELSGMQLAMIMRAIVSQLAVYLGTRVEYKPAETAANGEAASPPQ